MITWLPFNLIKYIVVFAIVVITYLYAHHSGYKESDTEWQLKQKTYLEESLKKQKEQSELNNKLQTEIEAMRVSQESTYKKQLQQISELKRLNVLDKKGCELNQSQSETLNKLMRGL